MAGEIKYDRLQGEMIRQGTYKTAGSKSLDDFIGLSQKYIGETYGKYFPGFSEEGVKSSFDIPLAKLVDGIFNTTKIDTRKPAPELSLLSRVQYGFLDMEPDKLIAGLSKKGFSKSQIGKVMMAYVLRRIDTISNFAEATNITLTDIDDFEDLPPANKFSTIVSEMSNYGFGQVNGYYDTVREIIGLTPDALLKNRQDFVRRFKKTQVIADKLDHDIARQFFGIQSKEFNYPLKRSEEFKFAFEQGLKYLRFCHESGTRPVSFAVAAETIATFWKNIRDNIPGLVASHINAITFWGTQLGRNPTDQDLKNLGISRRQFQSMVNHVFDERLRFSEASAFSIGKHDKSLDGYRGQPQRILLNSFKALLKSRQNILKQSGPISVMILVDDQSYLKIRLPADADDKTILAELNTNPTFIKMGSQEKFELKLDAYKPPKNRSGRFKEIYGFKGSKSGYGDFIIRLTTKRSIIPDGNHKNASSMFTVGPYQALVDINMDVPQGLEFSIKASHHNFDGVALSSFFDDMQWQISSQQNDVVFIDTPKILDRSSKRDTVPNDETLPLPDAVFSSVIENNYQTITVKTGKKSQKISPNVLRALDLALTNNVQYMHLLYNADPGNNPYSSPQWDNVQPVILSIEPIKPILAKFEHTNKIEPADKKKVMEYVEMVNNAITWARRGFSTPGVLSSPFGTMRNLASKITTSIYENVKLLNQSNGMFSPMVGENDFETAQSNAYNPGIDIANAKNHLGVIGSQAKRVPGVKPTLEDSAIYKVKKSPNQAQTAFREALVTNPKLKLDQKRQQKVTKQLDEILKGWEKLVFSDMGYKHGNPLVGFFNEDYNALLKRAFNTLKKDQYLGKANLVRLGIESHTDLQKVLNEILVADAKKTIDPERISKTHQMLTAFFKAVNG